MAINMPNGLDDNGMEGKKNKINGKGTSFLSVARKEQL
jgi:hypothetical protein